jgi:hypothetical protein
MRSTRVLISSLGSQGHGWNASLPNAMLILLEPEELLRAGDGIGVRTRRAGKIGERAGAGRRGWQTQSEVRKIDMDDNGNGGDDAADALRYLVATKSRAVAQRKLRGL